MTSQSEVRMLRKLVSLKCSIKYHSNTANIFISIQAWGQADYTIVAFGIYVILVMSIDLDFVNEREQLEQPIFS